MKNIYIEIYFRGFGRKKRDADLVHAKKGATKLLKGDLYVVSNAECRKVYSGKMVTKNMFCATSDEGVDTCQGDSGGPFMCKNKHSGLWEISGITSWGRGCSIDGYPGVYTNVVKYR